MSFSKSCGVVTVKGLTLYTILFTDEELDLEFARVFLNHLVPIKCGEFLKTESYYKKTYVFILHVVEKIKLDLGQYR